MGVEAVAAGFLETVVPLRETGIATFDGNSRSQAGMLLFASFAWQR